MTLGINVVPLPTGGGFTIQYLTAVSGTITLARSPYPNTSYTTIYTGPPTNPRGDTQYFIDLGDKGPGPLLPTSLYIYQLTDITGTIYSLPIPPVALFQLDVTNWDAVFIGMLQGAINSVQLPPGIKRSHVVEAMPLNGLLPMPFVVINNDLIQQEETPIGQSAPVLGEGYLQPPYSQLYTQTDFQSRLFRVSVFSQNATERTFYRDLIIATFRANFWSIFQQVGQDISHKYQATNYQTAASNDGMLPGFYASDVLLDLTGTQNVTIFTSYGIIEEITMATDVVIVPNLESPPVPLPPLPPPWVPPFPEAPGPPGPTGPVGPVGPIGPVGPSGGIAGPYISVTNSVVILSTQSGTVFDNQGATNPIDLTLPPWQVGIAFSFVIATSEMVTVIPNGSDQIGANGDLFSSLGSTQLYASLVLVGSNLPGVWIAYSLAGSWV